MRKLIKKLLIYAHKQTGLGVPECIPDVAFVSRKKLKKACASCETKGCVVRAAYVVYADGTSRVLLHKSWKKSSIEDRSLLLHELVHYLQDCNDEWDEHIEKAAYGAQFAYMRKRGVDPASLGYPEEFQHEMVGHA